MATVLWYMNVSRKVKAWTPKNYRAVARSPEYLNDDLATALSEMSNKPPIHDSTGDYASTDETLAATSALSQG